MFSVCVFVQNKYKQKNRLEISSSVFHQMPETKETEFVKQISELQSEVRRCNTVYVLVCLFFVLLSSVQHVQFGSRRQSTRRTKRIFPTRCSLRCRRLCRRSLSKRCRRRTARWETLVRSVNISVFLPEIAWNLYVELFCPQNMNNEWRVSALKKHF